jgi:hypothetical protein
VALGSGYYHWRPSNSRLVWDRLPMTVGFMSLIAVVVSETVQVAGRSHTTFARVTFARMIPSRYELYLFFCMRDLSFPSQYARVLPIAANALPSLPIVACALLLYRFFPSQCVLSASSRLRSPFSSHRCV